MCGYFHLTTACIFIQRLPMFYMQHKLFYSNFLNHEAAICLSVHLYIKNVYEHFLSLEAVYVCSCLCACTCV